VAHEDGPFLRVIILDCCNLICLFRLDRLLGFKGIGLEHLVDSNLILQIANSSYCLFDQLISF
jgi:hypothetical protein